MTNGKLEEIHDREVVERERSIVYSIALVAVVVIALVAVVIATVTIAHVASR